MYIYDVNKHNGGTLNFPQKYLHKFLSRKCTWTQQKNKKIYERKYVFH